MNNLFTSFGKLLFKLLVAIQIEILPYSYCVFDNNRLRTQSCDKASMMSNKTNGAQANIEHTHAHYIYC